MIETLKDLSHRRPSYECLKPSRNPSSTQLHHPHSHHTSHSHHHEPQSASSDSLTTTKAAVLSNASTIYGQKRLLDIVTYGSTHSRQITAAIVEHNPHGRAFVHCCSAKEDTRLAAIEHLLVITEDILHRLIDKEGITSSGWLPATPQSQHAATFNHIGTAHSSGPNLLRLVEVQSNQSSTPSMTMREPQALVAAPLDASTSSVSRRGTEPTTISPRDAGVPQQQVGVAAAQQAVAPQPTRAGKMQWMLGSEG